MRVARRPESLRSKRVKVEDGYSEQRVETRIMMICFLLG